jgi:ketosteroid isomerase-like protein
MRWFESSRPSEIFMSIREALEGLLNAWRSGDALRATAHFAEDGVYREARREPIRGREAIVAHFTRFFRDGPVWELNVDDIVVEGNLAAVSYRFQTKGKDGEWRENAGCAFVRFIDGSVAEWREYEG